MDRIFYKSDISDPITKLPIYIFDTSFLPSTDTINYDEFVPTLMNYLPTKPYVLIMFSCGLNKISWIWGIKFLKRFLAESDSLNNLIKIITVHDSWFVKSLTQILANFNMTKKNLVQLNKLIDTFIIATFSEPIPVQNKKNIIIHCSSLSHLSNYVDITKLKISLSIYKHNLLVENQLQLSMRIVPLINPYTQLNPSTDSVFFHHFYQIFNIINNYGDKVELLFHKPGNRVNTDILYQCINRNQLIWINDWDLYCISTTFKRILMELSVPLIPIDAIKLPISDSYEYTSTIFKEIVKSLGQDSGYDHLLIQLCELCSKILRSSHTTKHTTLSLSKSLSYCLSHELISSHNKDNVSIITRFFKNVLDSWHQLGTSYSSFCSIENIINGKETKQKPDDSYDISYDLTAEEPEEEEEQQNYHNHRVRFSTANILNNQPKFGTETPISSPIKNIPNTPKSVTSLRSESPVRSQESESMFSDYSSHSSASSVTVASTTSNKKKLSDVSNLFLQQPTQKYKLPASHKNHSRSKSLPQFMAEPPVVKKPVIRGRKVGELAKLFEERTQGLELLSSIQIS